jgi:Tol biopolymer transport system component
LANAPYYSTEQFFSWMPDNRRIVFNASPSYESASHLFIGDTVTDTFAQLTSGTDPEFSPVVTPDGKQLAFVSARAGLDLIELPVDGGPPRPLIRSSRDEAFPDVSASGILAYITDAQGWPGVRLRTGADAWSRTIGPEQKGGVLLDQVRLSPDGQRIAVDVLEDVHAIWIYPVDSGTPVRLETESTDQHAPSWSPDGNWIAYRRVTANGWALVKAPLGGGPVVRLADAIAGGVVTGGATDWSSSGKWIAYMRDDGVHVIGADGTSDRKMPGPEAFAMRFSRDGSRLLGVRRGADRRWQLVTWDVESAREIRTVTLALATSDDVHGLAVSPDESHIIVGAGSPTSDIWLLEQFVPRSPWWSRWFQR